METPKQPVDIAREAIRLLTRRQLPPTPDNFRKAYADVSGQDAPEEASWPAVLRPLLKQWEAHQTGLAQSRKREMLERVLINFGKDGRLLQEKLAALAKTWAEGAVGEPEESPASAPAALGATDAARDSGGTLRALADNLRRLAADCDARWPDLAGRAFDLARALDGGSGLDAARYEAWSALWKDLLARVDEEHELSAGLKRLMGLLFLNIGELVGDEAWLAGQFAAMEQLMSGELQAEALLEAERGLRELAHKQGVLKGSLDEARDRLKTLITTFIDRVGDMSRDADGYQARIGGYSERIGQARDIAELGDLMGDLSADVGGLRDALLRNHGELVAARAEAEQAEERVRELERELAQVSVLVREDQLTGALNRRGMDEAFARELARADRLGEALSVGLLDIDHFKKLNDGHGHQAGDEALRHLARVVRSLLRPTDSLARYGGEEFLILLPNSDVAEAERILQRIQRELTRQFFMHANERVLITFSAGVAQRQAGEDGAVLLARADAAMYQAKSLGRNRVERG